jgi:hypothetical protein
MPGATGTRKDVQIVEEKEIGRKSRRGRMDLRSERSSPIGEREELYPGEESGRHRRFSLQKERVYPIGRCPRRDAKPESYLFSEISVFRGSWYAACSLTLADRRKVRRKKGEPNV